MTTAMQKLALEYLTTGPVSVIDALRVGGPALVKAFALLTKRNGATVVCERMTYRLVVR